MTIKEKVFLLLFFIISSITMSGCATTAYDAQADQLLTKYAQTSNLQLFKFESEFESTGKVPKYDDEFYNSLHSDLAVIDIRMSALQQGEKAGELLTNQFKNFNKIIDDIQLLHKNAYDVANGKPENPLSPVKGNDFSPINFDVTRKLINSRLQTLIAYEASLKQP
ncbi:hypothetical protein [Aeromonas dhakensis]|uniref:hypothetical protein n=1 Tax=Aeromonas dhakensis TaxID=196024 RepID=UPI0039878D84